MAGDAGPQAGQRPDPGEGSLASPCIALCRLGESGYCLGCYRSLEEIAAWGRLDQAGRRRVMDALPARRNAVG